MYVCMYMYMYFITQGAGGHSPAIGNEYVFADSDSESIDPCDQNYPFM